MGPRAADLTAAAIAAYAPASLSPAAAAFARAAVAQAAPRRRERAKALLYAAGRLAAFGESVGMELRAEALWQRRRSSASSSRGCPRVSAATRRTLRTNLRALARAHGAGPSPQPAPLPRERAKAPYGEAEIDGYLRLAAAQPTEARRMRATALICLGAGAGLIGAELRHLSGRDVSARLGGLVVEVSGRRARAVPVAARFHRPLEEAARLRRGGLPARRAGARPSQPQRGAERRAVRAIPRWRALSRGGCGPPGFASARSRSACGRSWRRPGCAARSGSAIWWRSCRGWRRRQPSHCSEEGRGGRGEASAPRGDRRASGIAPRIEALLPAGCARASSRCARCSSACSWSPARGAPRT